VTIAVLAAAQLGKTVPGGEPAALMATSFAMERSYFDTLDPVPSVDLLHLPIGQPLGPAPLRPRWVTTLPGSWSRVATSKGLQDGRLVPHIGSREARGQRPRAACQPPLR
jgi:hypothetical protein